MALPLSWDLRSRSRSPSCCFVRTRRITSARSSKASGWHTPSHSRQLRWRSSARLWSGLWTSGHGRTLRVRKEQDEGDRDERDDGERVKRFHARRCRLFTLPYVSVFVPAVQGDGLGESRLSDDD